VVDSTVHDMIVPVNTTITYFPIWTLDLQNGKLALPYFANAGIPSTAYRFEIPANLDGCDDLFIMPHADPEWSTHNNLLWWNSPEDSGGAAGWIWANCHAVSVLENITNPSDPTEKMNFLSQQGAVSFKKHGKGTPPYNYNLHADPIMQFMGIADGALLNGSEQIYMPENGTWLPTTKIGIDDPDNPDIPSLTPGEASPMLFGPGFGNYENGRVMYAAGHSQDKGPEAEKVSAQRAFFNFAFQAIGARVTHPIANIPDTMAKDVPLILQVTTADKHMKNFTIEWVSQCPGYFSSTTDSIVTFTPTTESSSCFFMVIIRDSCNRPTFAYKTITVTPSPLPPFAVNDTANTLPYLPVTFNVLANDTDPNGDPISVSAFVGANPTANGGLFVDNGNGTVTYTPDPSYTGWDNIQYIVCDTSALCDTAIISVEVVATDNDNDGIPDITDMDDDNDGILDTDEGRGTDPSADLDGDAIPNFADTDFPGFVDANSDNVHDLYDTDLDGVPDNFDLDSDNDGVPDAIEANDGTAHANYSAISATISGVVGANGWPDAVDNIETANTALPVSDFDGDTQKDFQDIDADDDGIIDLREAGGVDSDNNTVIDGFVDSNSDGINDAFLSSPLPLTNSDAHGKPNYVDIDSDNDGIIDNIEGQTTSGYTAPTNLDADGDGLDNAYDPDNLNTPIIPVNFDGDANPDYTDTDTDNDSVIDRIEGNDLDSNNVADKTYSGVDADGDGLDNAYDPDFIVCTATALGQPANGGCAILQNFDGTDDRDWRDIDDDNDYIVTSGETGDANTNGQPDYLEYADGGGACTPPEIYYPDLSIDTLWAVTACYTSGVGNAANGTGFVDGVYTDFFGHLDIVIYNFGGPIPNGSKIHIYGDGTGTVTVGRNSGIPSCAPAYVHLANNLNINPLGITTTTWNDPNIVI
ncbi:MAG: Ig-like domain-containing protein, partial [Bacteroidia bacterium]|nr:Ig-like domain-containing protein [Bacteroidia bacterium]